MKDIQKDILDKITPEIRKEMESIWFSSDLHHGHNKIVNICNRPTCPQDQTEWLVRDVVNRYVKKNDTLYLLGDVSMAKKSEAEKFIDRLNGNKFLVPGNHDKNIKNSTRFFGIESVKDFKFNRGDINIHIVLCHYPMLSWNRRIHGAWHLYGHVHGRNPGVGRSLDVGIDNASNMYRPVNLYEVCMIMALKEAFTEDTIEWTRGFDEGSN